MVIHSFADVARIVGTYWLAVIVLIGLLGFLGYAGEKLLSCLLVFDEAYPTSATS
jgi:hypothetical protein